MTTTSPCTCSHWRVGITYQALEQRTVIGSNMKSTFHLCHISCSYWPKSPSMVFIPVFSINWKTSVSNIHSYLLLLPCSSRLLLTTAPHACSSLLLLTPAPHACSSCLLLTPAPHACSSCLLLTPAPHACSSLLLLTPAPHACSSRLLLTPAPHSCSSLLLLSPAPHSCSSALFCLLPCFNKERCKH